MYDIFYEIVKKRKLKNFKFCLRFFGYCFYYLIFYKMRFCIFFLNKIKCIFLFYCCYLKSNFLELLLRIGDVVYFICGWVFFMDVF